MKPRSTPPRRIAGGSWLMPTGPQIRMITSVEDQRQAEGEEQLVVVPGGVEPADAGVFDHQAEQRHAERRDQQRDPEIADRRSLRVDEEIGAHGEQRAVGEVRDVEDAR